MFKIYNNPPTEWKFICDYYSSLFHSKNWAQLYNCSFNCYSLYAWDDDSKDGLLLTVFKIGLFKVAYAGYPVGGTISNLSILEERIHGLIRALSKHNIHVLRLPFSSLNKIPKLNFPYTAAPETSIRNIEKWAIDKLSKRSQRYIRKALNSNIDVSLSTHPNKYKNIYSLYRAVIKIRKGHLRYNEPYFKNLLLLSNKNWNIRCSTASIENRIIAFLIVCIDKNVAYYLHGAMNYKFKHLYPMDRLFYENILIEKKSNRNTFNLMSSPKNQASLIAYKEKWGGETEDHITYSIELKPFTSKLFTQSEKLYKSIIIPLKNNLLS